MRVNKNETKIGLRRRYPPVTGNLIVKIYRVKQVTIVFLRIVSGPPPFFKNNYYSFQRKKTPATPPRGRLFKYKSIIIEFIFVLHNKWKNRISTKSDFYEVKLVFKRRRYNTKHCRFIAV